MNESKEIAKEVAIEIVKQLSLHAYRSGSDVIIVLELDGEEISQTKVDVTNYTCI